MPTNESIRARLKRGLEICNNQFDYPFNMTHAEARYLLERLERAEALLHSISLNHQCASCHEQIADYFRSQTSEENQK